MNEIGRLFLFCATVLFITSCSSVDQDIVHYQGRDYTPWNHFYEDCYGFYKNDEFIRNGPSILYNLGTCNDRLKVFGWDGSKAEEGTYVNGVRQGIFTNWFPHGPKSSECNYNSKGEMDGREIVFEWDSINDKTTRYWKNGKPWEGEFLIFEKVIDKKYFKTYARQRHALLTYKDGTLVSNSNPSIQDYYIVHGGEIETTKGDVEDFPPSSSPDKPAKKTSKKQDNTGINDPMFDVLWKFDGDKISFTAINIYSEYVMLWLPLEKPEGKDIAYDIFLNEPENGLTRIGKWNTMRDGPCFKTLSYKFNKTSSYFRPEQSHETTVPSMVKAFENIRQIDVELCAVPISKLKEANDMNTFISLFLQYRQTYSIDFTKAGHEKKEGKLLLIGPKTPTTTP